MNNNNKLPRQAKPQEFELVELLFKEYINSHIATSDIDYSFQARFQSFINQIPSYLHSSSKPGFFIHFFFGSFVSLLDTKLSQKINIKKLHYNFDTIDTLRIVAEIADKTHVFIFTENNKKQKQNKQKELEFTTGEWQMLKGRAYNAADKNNLEISVIKVNKSKGNIKVTVEKQNIKDSADSIKQYHEVTRQLVDEKGKYIYLDGEISKLSSSQADKQTYTLKFVLKYIKKIHDHYQILPYAAGAQEADQHGFVAGIFNNFRYRENAHVYLEQFAGKGYADIVLLVRGAGRSTTSIPIIIELKAGSGIGTTSGEALAQVTEYTKGFQPNNMRILTIPDNILCIGMNLDHDTNSFMQIKLTQRQVKVIPVIQSIITHIMENDFATQNQINDLLQNTYYTFPGTGEKSAAHYYSRFIIGESLVLQDHDKHIFLYDKADQIATKTIINQHATRSQDGPSTKKQKIEKIVDDSNAVTSILLISKDQADPAIILNIIDANRDVVVKNTPLNGYLIGNRKIISLDIKFNVDQHKEEFQKYCNVEIAKVYSSVLEYNYANNEKARGKFEKIDFKTSIDLLAQIKDAIDSQKGLIISESKYKELFKKIGEVIYPIKSLINHEAEFQGLLEGIFKYYSDTKLAERSERREIVLTEFQTGAGGRIDMIIQAIGEYEQGTKEYTPVGFELKYDDSIKLRSFDQKQDEYVQRLILRHKEQVLVKKLLDDQIVRYSQGVAIKSITDGNEVVILGIVFNKQAEDADSLLLTTDKFLKANIVHSSELYSISKNVNAISINDIPKPDFDNFLPDWVERETYDLLAKAQGEDNDILYLSNSLLNDEEMRRLQDLLQKDKQLARYIDGLDLSFNSITASSVKELIKKLEKVIYLDLSDNDLVNNNLLDLEAIIEDIQVPILKIADIGINDEQMGKIFKSLAEHDKISDLEITHLDDDKLIMSSNTASEIEKYLRSTQSLKSLNLAKNQIGDEAISIIVQGLQRQSTLSSLVLTENSIGVEGAKKLGNVLKNSAISDIDLSGNPFGVLGVKAIVEGLEHANNIKSIELVNVNLKYNGYDRDTAEKLLSSIKSLFKNPHLTKVNIAYNDIGNGALSDIFNILSESEEKSNLQDLSLAGNEIAHQVTISTLKYSMYDFISKNNKIRSLDLSLMEIDDDIGKSIADALEKNVSLVNLDLGGNDRIGSKTVTSLANVLRTHQYLQYLNLSDNKLSIADLKLILGAIKMNKVVSHIDLSGNDFSGIINDQTSKQYFDLNNQDIDFVNLLQGNTELKYLNLANCKLNHKSLLSLFKAIENNVGLEVLDIRDNEIENSIVNNIVESLNKNANQGLDIGLKVLHVSKGGLEQSIISKLTDKSLGISVSVEGSILPQNSLEERLMQTYVIDPVDKKYARLDREHQTFESETIRDHYHYWLQAHDMVDIARIHYGYGNRAIEIVGSIRQLSTQITQYFVNNNNTRVLTMILNIGGNGAGGNHWVSLVLNRVGGSNYGYYVNSVGNTINGNVASILSQHRILIHDLSNQQQTDGHNCGLWALENSRIVCDILEANINNVDINSRIRSNLISRRTEEEFEEIRDNILRELLNDNQRRVNLENIGLHQVKMPTTDNDVISGPNLQGISIMQACLPSISRSTRSISECKIGWSDVDEISSSKTRNIEEIEIDSKKFLEYSKKHVADEQKSMQLVKLAEEIKNKDHTKIVGEYTGLLDQVTEVGGYTNYVQQERMKDIGYNILNSAGGDSVSPKLTLKLINAVGKIQLIHGIHGTIVSCQDGNGDTSSCVLSVGGLGYSFLSQPIENMMVKMTPKMLKNAADVTSRIVPRVLSYDIKFVVQVFGAKYGIKIAKGGAGALAGIFDIVDIGTTANILIECNKRANSNNTCSDKVIRDNIAAISFASVSFVSGVALVAMGAGPASVVVGAVIMVGQGTYSGISNIIEYKKKYDTTHGENWSIFWRTIFFKRMSEDVEHLKARHEFINHITNNAWDRLNDFPNEIVAYAVGLGTIELQCKPLCITTIKYLPVFCIGLRPSSGPCKDGGTGFIATNITECTIRSKYIPVLHPAASNIDLHHSSNHYTHNLSRVLPREITNATMICLPKITTANYEKGLSQSKLDAVYECDNALVMIHDHRRYSQIKDKYIVYDLLYVNSGLIIGSHELHNIFLLFNGTTQILGGSNTINEFIIQDNKFGGQIFWGRNSTNILNIAQQIDEIVNFKITNVNSSDTGLTEVILDGHSLVKYFRYDNVKFHYIGRKNKIDNIICEPTLHIVVDGGGGYSNDKKDSIINCDKVIVRPFTEVISNNSIDTLFVKSEGYINQVSSSIIDVHGNGTIVFSDTSLLKDCDQITHSVIGNILSFKIPLSQNGTFTLHVKNYFDTHNNTNFRLIDKYGSNIIVYPHIVTSDIYNQIKYFVLYTECKFYTTKEVIEYYKNISSAKENYVMFSTVKNTQYNNFLKFGSSERDIITIDKNVVYVEGNNGSDLYVIDDIIFYGVHINNQAKDLQLDILKLPVNNIYDILLVRNTDNLHLLFNNRDEVEDNKAQDIQQEVIIDNYFQDNIYQHIALMDGNNNSYIPFKKNYIITVLPFYHASLEKNIFILSPNDNGIVIDIDNIVLYKQESNLLITERKSGSINNLNIILRDYYKDKKQWLDTNLYVYNYGISSIIDLNHITTSVISNQEQYDGVIQEYVVNLSKESKKIAHDQQMVNDELIATELGQENIGVVIFQNITPSSLEVIDHDDDLILADTQTQHQLIIKNWYQDNKYIISILEFNLGIELIRIHILDKNDGHRFYLQSKINCAAQLYNNKLLINNDLENILKCIILINSIDVPNIYPVLGFNSLQKAVSFIKYCNATELKLANLKIISTLLVKQYSTQLSDYIELQPYDYNKLQQYYDVINSHISPILSKVIDRIDLNDQLDSKVGKLNIETLKAVKYLLISGGALYSHEEFHESLGFNTLKEQSAFVEEYTNNYTEQQIKDHLHYKNHAGQAIILLLTKSYNELLFTYPNIQEKELLNKLDKCFEFILSKQEIHRVVKHVQGAGAIVTILKFIDNHKHALQKQIEAKAAYYWNDYDDMNYDSIDSAVLHERQRREVGEEDLFVISSAGSKSTSIAHNIVKWATNSIAMLEYLNPVEQIKYWFNKDASRIDEEIIDITNNSEQSNNQVFEENQDILESKLLGIKSIEEQILELEDNKIEAKSFLRKLQQKVKIAEGRYRGEEASYREYEEELSNRLEQLVKKRLWIQKQASEEYMELIRLEINNKIEKKEAEITKLCELNYSYWYELKSVRTKLSKNENMVDLIILSGLEDKIQNSATEDRKLNNDLEKLKEELQACNALDTDEIPQYIRKLDKLNIDKSNVLSEEEYLTIKGNDLINKRQAIGNIRDQIKEKECIIEEYSSKLNELNKQLEVLQAEVKDLSLNNKLLYWKQQVIAQDYNDVLLQEPDKGTMQFSQLEEENTVAKIERFRKHHEKELKQEIISELKVNESTTLFTMESLIKAIDTEEQQRVRRAIDEENESVIENIISDNVVSNSASSMSSPINNMVNWLRSSIGGVLLSNMLNPVNKIHWFTAENIKTTSMGAKQIVDSSINSTAKDSTSIKLVDYAQFNLHNSLTLADFIIRKITKVKSNITTEEPLNLLEVQAHLLNIIAEFEKMLEKYAQGKDSLMEELEFDPITLQTQLISEIVNGNRSNIVKILSNFIEKTQLIIKNPELENYLQNKITEMLEKQHDMLLANEPLIDDRQNNHCNNQSKIKNTDILCNITNTENYANVTTNCQPDVDLIG